MSEQDLDFITKEINFYMDKQFQFSFIYTGALLAIIAGTKIEIFSQLSSIFNSTTLIIALWLISVLNLIFLIVISSSGYAVIKRGLFILSMVNNSKNVYLVEWERFTRKSYGDLRNLAWNIDNYYTAFIYAIGFITSIGVFIYAVPNSAGFLQFTFIGISALHLIPLWSIFQLYKLNKICRSLVPTSE